MQYKPMTRGKLAKFLGTYPKMLMRFCKKEGIEIEPRALLRPKLIELIIKKFNGEDDVYKDAP